MLLDERILKAMNDACVDYAKGTNKSRNNAAFARAINVQPSTVGRWLEGKAGETEIKEKIWLAMEPVLRPYLGTPALTAHSSNESPTYLGLPPEMKQACCSWHDMRPDHRAIILAVVREVLATRTDGVSQPE